MTHLDDALLSAHLDGEALGGGDVGHLAACEVCTARLGRLRAAAALVATPVPPPPGRAREAAIAAVLDAGRPAVRPAGHEPRSAESRSGVVTLRGRRVRAASPWLAAAAVIGALVLGVGLLSNGGGGADDVASPATLDEPAGAQAQLEAADGAGLAVVDGGDLGELADGDALRAIVEQRLAGREAAASTAAADAPQPASGEGGAGGTAGGAPAEAARCEDSLRAADPRLGSLVYVATLRWEGTPSVLLAFALPEGRLTTAVYVVAPAAGCELLVQQSF